MPPLGLSPMRLNSMLGDESDEPYRLNTRTIYRGREGNWFRANAAWQAAFRTVVHGERLRLLDRACPRGRRDTGGACERSKIAHHDLTRYRAASAGSWASGPRQCIWGQSCRLKTDTPLMSRRSTVISPL